MTSIEEKFRNRRVLITGHTGFKGSWLSLWLNELGAEVYGVSNEVCTNPSMYESLKLSNVVQSYTVDVRNLIGIKNVIDEVKPEFVFHLAAQAIVSTSFSDPLDTLSTNIMGTANVLEALRLYNQECSVVIVTSDKCYDNVEWPWGYKETDHLGGKDIYSGSKGAAELVVKSYLHSFLLNGQSNIRVATARAGNVIGGGDWAQDRIIPDCMKAWSKQEQVEIRSPKATRPWQHVLEPLSGYLQLAVALSETPSVNGESFNFGPRAEYNQTVFQLISDLEDTWTFEGTFKAINVTGNAEFYEAGLLKLNCDKSLYHLKWISTLNYDELLYFVGDWYNKFYNYKDVNMFEYSLNQIRSYTEIARSKSISWACKN
jgi:CDP-glucose 4,6-dehydratase